jgi:hypothetical protein
MCFRWEDPNRPAVALGGYPKNPRLSQKMLLPFRAKPCNLSSCRDAYANEQGVVVGCRPIIMVRHAG